MFFKGKLEEHLNDQDTHIKRYNQVDSYIYILIKQLALSLIDHQPQQRFTSPTNTSIPFSCPFDYKEI